MSWSELCNDRNSVVLPHRSSNAFLRISILQKPPRTGRQEVLLDSVLWFRDLDTKLISSTIGLYFLTQWQPRCHVEMHFYINSVFRCEPPICPPRSLIMCFNNWNYSFIWYIQQFSSSIVFYNVFLDLSFHFLKKSTYKSFKFFQFCDSKSEALYAYKLYVNTNKTCDQPEDVCPFSIWFYFKYISYNIIISNVS